METTLNPNGQVKKVAGRAVTSINELRLDELKALYEYIIKNDLSMKPIDLAGIQKVIISVIVYFLAILITEKSIKFFVPGVFDYFMNDLNTEPDFTQHFKSLQPWQSICITCFFTVRRCDWVIFLGFYISAISQMGFREGTPYCGAFLDWVFRQCEVSHHVASPDEEDFMTIGGNTSAIKGGASGEGVHRKIRPKDIAVVSRMF